MPRRADKSGGGSAARSSSKRAAPAKATPTRQSKRVKATPTKISYTEPTSDDENKESQSRQFQPSDASDYEEIGSNKSATESEVDATDSEDDMPKKKAISKFRPVKHTALPVHQKRGKEEELWKPGANLEPGMQNIIKKPKARDAGATPYTDETIHPNTMLFLKDLGANNDRQWLKCKYFPCIFHPWSYIVPCHLASRHSQMTKGTTHLVLVGRPTP